PRCGPVHHLNPRRAAAGRHRPATPIFRRNPRPEPVCRDRPMTASLPPSTEFGPLDGIKVVEVASIVLGPLATQYLGDMGADVIKIEPPGGDLTRSLGPQRNPGMSAVFLNCNRN